MVIHIMEIGIKIKNMVMDFIFKKMENNSDNLNYADIHKKVKYRRESKGHRCYMWDRIYCTKFLAALVFLHWDDLKSGMNCTRMN